MECSSMAGTTSFRVLATILLLAIAGRCYSQQMDHIQLSRIAAAIENLTQVEQAQAVASEKVASGIMKLFTSATTQAVASEKVASGIMKLFTSATNHLVCEEDWFKLRSSCYFISKDTSTWEESRQKCIALNSDLVKITHDDEFNFLRDLAKGHHTYIGLSDIQEEGTFRWVADGTVHQIVESWWRESEPNNCDSCGPNSSEDCVHYHSSNDGLNDVGCDTKFRYICEKPAHLDWNFASVLFEETPTEK